MANEDEFELIKKGICPSCGRGLIHSEGCIECEFCGWSACTEA